MANPFYKIGPQKTPKIIQILLLLFSTLSFFAAIQVSFFPDFPLQQWLSLSWLGWKEHLYFQPLSYLFLIQTDGVSISFFFNLAFHLYLLWVFGTSILERCGKKHFLILFFGSGILAAIFGLLVMSLSYPFHFMAGNSIVLYSLLLSWVMLNPKAELRLFFAIPFKAKWVILISLGFPLLLALADWDFVTFVTYSIGGLFGYLFILFYYQAHSPLAFLYNMEKKVITFSLHRKEKKLAKRAKMHEGTKKPSHSDDTFMDSMLHKISLHGEKSLSSEERNRMHKISKERREKR